MEIITNIFIQDFFSYFSDVLHSPKLLEKLRFNHCFMLKLHFVRDGGGGGGVVLANFLGHVFFLTLKLCINFFGWAIIILCKNWIVESTS